MSFLDDQATGQIGIGERASLGTLTRRKRKRKRGQDPAGAQTYSLMPQNKFSSVVSSPTDITQVGIGKKLQAQGTAASSVKNVFRDYTSAAPIGTTLEAIYYKPPPEEEEEDEDLPDIANDPMQIPSHDTGVDDPFSGNFQDHFAVDDPTVTADQSQAVPGTEGPDFFSRGDLSEAQGRESGSARGPQGATSLAQWAGGIMEGIMGLTTFMPSSIALNVLNELTGGKPPPSKVEPPARSVGTGRSAAGGQGNPPSNPDSFSGVGAAASTGDDAAAYSDSGPSGTPPSYSSIGLD